MTTMRNALRALGAGLAVVALCAPLMLLPEDDTQPVLGYAGVTLTVPPTVVVATTIPGLETTTTTTELPKPAEPVPTSSTTTTTGPIDITIAAMGEVLPSPSLLESVRDEVTKSHDFGPVLAPVAPYLARADYTVAMLGSVLGAPQAGSDSSRAASAPRELAFALRKAGVDLAATAGDHSLDLGWDGLVGTLDRLDAAGLAHVGTARTQQERKTPVIADIRGIKVAFLDYTSRLAKPLPTDEGKDFAVNILDLATVKQDAATARSWGADAVVALVKFAPDDRTSTGESTGPDEATSTSTTAPQGATAEALSEQILNQGVDAVLGSQAGGVRSIGHIFPYASWQANDKYVAYSLGDFFPDDPDGTESGLVAYLHLQKRGLRTYVTGVSYLPLYVQTSATVEGSGTSATSSSTTSTSTSETVPSAGDVPVTYRVLPVLPGLDVESDIPLGSGDRQRMAKIWEDARALLYRPDESISPLLPSDLGLSR